MKTLPVSFLSVLGAASWVLLPPPNAVGQTSVTTTPVGYLQTPCLSGSDTLVAPPFTRPPAFIGAVSSISGGTVTFNSPGFTAGQYSAPTATPPTADTFYLSIGPATATLAGTLTVTSGSTAVTGSGTTFGTDVKVGDRITINDGYNLLTYTVTAIGSTTSLTIDRAYTDSAATGNTSSVVARPTAAKTTTIKGATTTTLAKSAATASAATSGSLSGLSATYDHSPYEGRFYQVTTNDTGSVTVNLNGDTLASVAAGTQVSIIPYWTLNTVFPAANAGVSFTATTSPIFPETEILVPDYSSSGTNLAATAIYLFYTDGGSNVGWRIVGDTTTDHGHDIILPDGYVTVRTASSAPTLPVTFSGSVSVNKLATTLATRSSGQQDNAVALNRPADTTLGALGLNPTDGSFLATTSPITPEDELFVYNNSTAAINKSSSAIYIYYNGGASNTGWRVFGDLSTDHSTDVIPAGSALTIRKAATTAGQTAVWSNSPNY